jgi:hypothetical protein
MARKLSTAATSIYRDHVMLKHLSTISWAITILGLVITLASLLLGFSPLWMLTGLFLVIAGVVKLGMLLIWTRLARLGTDEHSPIDAL